MTDRANEDAETATHFLNQVIEVDLLALIEDGEPQEELVVCNCAEKCQAGAVNTFFLGLFCQYARVRRREAGG